VAWIEVRSEWLRTAEVVVAASEVAEQHVEVAGLLDAVTDAGELVLLIQTANKNVEPSIVRLLIQVLVNVE